LLSAHRVTCENGVRCAISQRALSCCFRAGQEQVPLQY
jgi:hypothetical protein